MNRAEEGDRKTGSDDMTIDELVQDIVEDFVDDGVIKDEESQKRQIKVKVKNAINEVKLRRSYPSSFSDKDISNDLESLRSNIYALALYDYNQIGAEGQTSHSSSGTSRTWKSRDECLNGVFAWAGI